VYYKGSKSGLGKRVPDEKLPLYYEPFMDLTSKSVKIDDGIFLKRIQYKFTNEYATVGFGAFKKVLLFNQKCLHCHSSLDLHNIALYHIPLVITPLHFLYQNSLRSLAYLSFYIYFWTKF